MKTLFEMKKIILVCISLFFLFLPSCHKEKLEDYDHEFGGLWKTDTITLASGGKVQCILNVNGKDSWYGWMCDAGCSVICNCQIRKDGRAKVDKKKRRIYIGFNLIKDLIINKAPFLDTSGRMACELGDLKYYRQ